MYILISKLNHEITIQIKKTQLLGKNTVYWNKWQKRIWFIYLSTWVICYHSVVLQLNQYTQIFSLLPSGRPWLFTNLGVAVPVYANTTRFPAEHLPTETGQWNNRGGSSELKKSAPRSVCFRLLQVNISTK